jgi:hypothetical protein
MLDGGRSCWEINIKKNKKQIVWKKPEGELTGQGLGIQKKKVFVVSKSSKSVIRIIGRIIFLTLIFNMKWGCVFFKKK